jgi:hypothetical protein
VLSAAAWLKPFRGNPLTALKPVDFTGRRPDINWCRGRLLGVPEADSGNAFHGGPLLKPRIAGNIDILDLDGEDGKRIRLVALKTMLKLHQVDEVQPLLEKSLELDGNGFELNLIYASTLVMDITATQLVLRYLS